MLSFAGAKGGAPGRPRRTAARDMADFLRLENKADLDGLVADGVEESLTLEYKASAALAHDSKKIDECCKDVSALANSAGGQIVYGIPEVRHKPQPVDAGSDGAVISREWIEQILLSRVHACFISD